MTFLHFLVIAFVGLILLGTARNRPWLRGIAIAGTLVIALGASYAAVELLRLGHRMQWTSEGPGIIGVVLAIVVAGVFALLGWSGLWRQLSRSSESALVAPGGVLLIVIGLVGAAASGLHHTKNSRPSHDVDVVQLAFNRAGDVLYSLDQGGTLKAWDPETQDCAQEWHDPALARATSLQIAPSGNHALVSGADGTRVLDLSADPEVWVVAQFPDVVIATFAGDAQIALARPARLEIVDLRAGEATRVREIVLGAEIEALAGIGATLAVATRDGTVALFEADGGAPVVRVELPSPVRRLALSPEGVRIAAISAEQRAWLIARDGSVEEAPRWMSFGHAGFLHDDLLVAAGDRMPELLSLRLPSLQTSPFLNHGIGVTALAASSSQRRVAVAFGPNLHLTGTLGADPRAVVAARLLDPRL